MFLIQYLMVDLPLFYLAFFLRSPPFLFIGGCFFFFPLFVGLFLFAFFFKLICFDFLTLWCELLWWRPVRYSRAVSLITLTWCSWDVLYAFYAGFLHVIGFWLLLGHSFMGPSLSLVDWGSLCPPRLICCCAGAAWTKPQSPGNKPTPTNICPPNNPTINIKWTSIN